MAIIYTSDSWNYQAGCTHLKKGCKNCYAAREASTRLAHLPFYNGLASHGQWAGTVRFHTESAKWYRPIRALAPKTYFVNSTSDTFHPAAVAEGVIPKAWAVMALAPWHRFLVLTKRIALAREYLSDPEFYGLVLASANLIRSAMPSTHPCQRVGISNVSVMPLPNVWVGTSASTQEELADAVERLQGVPASIRWLSLEPLIERVDLSKTALPFLPHGHPDWIVCGGESGPGARPFDAQWARDLIKQCDALHLPFYFKQWGANPVDGGKAVKLKHRKGEDWDEWPEGLHVRQEPWRARIVRDGATKLVYDALLRSPQP